LQSLVEQTLGPLLSRTELQHGSNEQRRHTVAEVRRRLKPGAPFITAHSSFPQDGDQRALWLSR